MSEGFRSTSSGGVSLARGSLTRVLRILTSTLFLLFGLAMLGCKTIPDGKTSVDAVSIRGSGEVDDGDIADKIATTPSPKLLGLVRGVIYEYSIFDRFILQRDLARIEAFYRSKGFYEAHARAARIHTIEDKHVEVEIVVDEGEPVRIRNVKIVFDGPVPPDIDGAARAAARRMRKDRVFEEERYRDTEGKVRRALSDNGYARAQVKSDAAVDLVAHAVDVTYSVTVGPRCTFGEVKIEGLGELPDAPVRRAIDIDPGSEYSDAALESAQQAVLNFGVFASVKLTPILPDEGAQGGACVVPVRVEVEPARLRTVRLGGGLEFDAIKADIHGLAGWENRNLFGGLRSFSVELRPGVVLHPLRFNNIKPIERLLPEERFRVEFKQPGLFEARTNGFIRQNVDIYPVLLTSHPPDDAPVLGYGETQSSVGLERSLWKLYGAIAYNLQVDVPFPYKGEKDPNLDVLKISYPELYVSLDLRDNAQHPRSGFWMSNRLQVAGGIFGGDADDIKIQPDARGYIPLGRRFVLASRASIGLLEPRNYGSVVANGPLLMGPDHDRTHDFQLTFFRGFFSGGPTQNRGYPVRGISPYDVIPFLSPEISAQRSDLACGTQCLSPTGGFTLWEASVELRYTVTGPLSIATFIDTSDVAPQRHEFRFNHPHLSWGGGARYDTPVGPVRLDIGYRIPGLQVLGGLTRDEAPPPTIFGAPIAISLGIGEAY